MINYEFFDQNRLLIIRFSGVVDKTALISFINFLIPKIDPVVVKRIITDSRDSRLLLSPKDIDELILTQSTSSDGKMSGIRQIFLVNNPNDTLLGTLFVNKYKAWACNICSTTEYCIRHLGLDISSADLEKMISGLNFNYRVT